MWEYNKSKFPGYNDRRRDNEGCFIEMAEKGLRAGTEIIGESRVQEAARLY